MPRTAWPTGAGGASRGFGDEPADDDEIVFGDGAVAVTERLGHGRQDSGAGIGPRDRANTNQIANVPPALTLQPNSKQFELAHRSDTLLPGSR